ncbi:MAG TPA: ABC transporter substrate-binding protein [Stellaceae bacterium]|jgi:NitT/TauT family transport system substrate-binding protein|nr:ABC transporter substrate-binding protein [Stellaceae bacterium]
MLKLWGVMAVAAAALLGAAMGPVQADPVKFRIGWASVPGSRAGFMLEKPELLSHLNQSYTIEPMHFSNTPAELQALASGDMDIAQLGYSTLGAAVENAHMADIRLIANELEDGVPGWATTHFMVLQDSPIKSIDDLKGKVVATNGIGSGLDIAMRYILLQHHMSEKRDYTDVEINFPNMRPALAEHKVDLVSAILPFMYEPEMLKIGRVLFEQGAEVGPSELLMWAARAPYIAAHRAALVDLMEDNLQMIRWYSDPANHQAAVAMVAKLTKQPPEALDWVFTKRDDFRGPDGAPDLKSVDTDLKMEKTLGYLKSEIDVSKYADLTIAAEAFKRLGPEK